MTKDLGPFFPQNIEFDRPQRTVTDGQQGFLTFIMRVKRSHFWDVRGQLKKCPTKINFLVKKKDFGLLFLLLHTKAELNE